MDLIQVAEWGGILAMALFVLVRGADLFVEGAKQVGASFGMSSFAIGVFIVGIGTSLPELAASFAAVAAGTTEMVVANVVGSNITNILLIVGILATVSGPVMINRNLLKTELPIFFVATMFFVLSLHDGEVDRLESLLLVGTFSSYVYYLFSPSNKARKEMAVRPKRGKVTIKDITFIVFGIVAVLMGAHYAVAMAVNIATGLAVPIGLVSIGAIAIGTSLPELFVSWQAMKSGETELAIGNIFGSNAFNIFLVVGIPGLFVPLEAGAVVMGLGIWVMIVASLMLFLNGLARQVQQWEGMAMLLFFFFFLFKLMAFI
ncbi:MAG: hypothetical protein RLZZ230_492 [Candidatus Parcubacteria bacterium]|jgi:cation:H+ antiporter